ncbi:Dynamin central region [Geosmithia morbida]|uniref:Dynamin central region n=1 Tax=Geosmithia morbida TaxID=1094350 RepID=A0A9P4Z1G2_9HYPO|nr:Dynamin central region [Geosmithia morbida]KAF4124889.1 Dynamin central region [Geosmithia morbida]
MASDGGGSLISKSHRDVLDIVDSLRSSGVGQYIELPQIIVCGDQSAGKSSVLEAISGLSFPTKDALCTRFATELILRRSKEGTSHVKFSIIPGPGRDEVAEEKLRDFQYATSDETETNLGHVVDAAAVQMAALDGPDAVFFKDILRVEMSSPQQPHLTLVDLPGLFLAGSKDQSIEDAQLVESLVMSYMKQPRSIILAVVSAKSEFNLQQVTELTRQVDPEGTRTLGLITKPDTLDGGSEGEQAYFNMAQNKDVKFRLGWHVIKNRDFKMRNCTREERDASEKAFFSTGIWQNLSPTHLGISALVSRLSKVLHDHNLAQLPRVMDDIQSGIDDCRTGLERLGESRGTLTEQRRYLLRVAHTFTSLVSAAVDGAYTDQSFFGDVSSDAGYARRLRARVQNALIDFSDHIHCHGHSDIIVDDDSRGSTEEGMEPEASRDQKIITRSEMVRLVKKMMSRSRGRELPGTFNPLLVDEVISDANDMLVEAMRFSTDDDTAENIIRGIVTPDFKKISSNVKETLYSISRSHMHGHPITYNHYLTDTVQDAQKSRLERNLKEALSEYYPSMTDAKGHRPGNAFNTMNPAALLSGLVAAVEQDMETFAAAALVDTMQAYYKVSLKRFIDDIGVLVIEEHLMNKLPEVFSPDVVCLLGDDRIAYLAGESDETMEQRKRLTEKLSVLQKCRDQLNNALNRGFSSSIS